MGIQVDAIRIYERSMTCEHVNEVLRIKKRRKVLCINDTQFQKIVSVINESRYASIDRLINEYVEEQKEPGYGGIR